VFKAIFFKVMVFSFLLSGSLLVYGQDVVSEGTGETDNLVSMRGEVVEIVTDGNYIVVNDGSEPVKIFTGQDFIENSYLEVGDPVKIYGEKTPDGIMLTDYEYDYQDSYEEDVGFDEGYEDIPQEDYSHEMPEGEFGVQ